MAIDAVDAADRVEQLVRLTERLTNMLALEAKAFEERRPHDVAGQMAETNRLANLYRHESSRIKAEPALIIEADMAAKRRLIWVTEAFEAVLARHGRALAAAKTVTEGLVHAIADEVASARRANAPYGPRGAAPAGDAAAITLNKSA
jgi:hypothetical protein